MFIGHFDPIFGSNNTSASPNMALFAATEFINPKAVQLKQIIRQIQ